MQNHSNQLPWYELLRKEREQRSLTQEEVAARIGVEPKTVMRWENGKSFPGPRSRRRLAAFYKKTLRDLGFVEETTSNENIQAPIQLDEEPSEKETDFRDVASVAAIGALHHHRTLPDPANTPAYSSAPASVLTRSQAPLFPSIAVPATPITSSQLPWRRPYVLIAGICFLVLIIVVIVLVLRIAFLPNTSLSLHPPTKSPTSTTPTQSSTSPITTCPGDTNGVTLYADLNYQGHCRTFAPGQYDLSKFGLAQKVRSLKDPGGAYHITLFDQFGRPGYFENDTPQLPLHLDKQASSLRVDNYPPTSCNQASDSIIGYVEVNYQGGCLSITQSIPDLGVLPFDHVISSLRFVGSYLNTRQLLLYRQPNYLDQCGGMYSQNQPDLATCAGQAASVRVLPYTPPTPIPTATTGIIPPPVVTCPQDNTGVTLYVDPNFQGYCHTFPPGDYDLSQFGLDQNVSSLRDPNAAYHVTLVDKSGRPGYFDADVPQLPADWNDLAHSLRVEKHRPTSCNPGSNGIIAYIDPNYHAGCFFITGNIPDLTPLNFDHVISSIRFVGSYVNTMQLVIYQQSNYQGKCGAYSQDQPDLMTCSDQAVSVQVLPYTPPTPTPTPHYFSLPTAVRKSFLLSTDFDLLIAATAIQHHLTLVTRNTKDYDRIPNLEMYQAS